MQSLRVFQRLGARLLLAAMLIFSLMAGIVSPVAAASDSPGTVYIQTNAADGNQVWAFDRAQDGTLIFQAAYSTGGLGSGAGLGSQGSVALSENNRWLFAVNAGSNSITVFEVRPDGLVLSDRIASGGSIPISLTVYQDLLYVLNAGGSGNITGFAIDNLGHLSPIAGSTRYLSNGGSGAAPGPAQVSFAPDGRTLVVTEKATSLIDTYEVIGGVAGEPSVHASVGNTPFGFAFSGRDFLIVSEAFPGQAGKSAASSYLVDGNDLNVISPSVGTTQSSACWVAVSKNGKYAYTTNAASGSISGFQVGNDGSLSLQNATAGLTGAGSSPIDMAFSANGAYLYALNSGTHTISFFEWHSDGSLAPLGMVDVPAGSVGLAAR